MTDIPAVPESHLDIMKENQGVLSTLRRDGLISTNPVAFDYDGQYVRISTLKSRIKYTNLLHNPLATFCAVSRKDPTRYIEIRGRAELIDDPTGAFQLKLWKRMTGLDEFTLDPPGAERVIIKLIPEQVSTPTLYGGKLSR